MLIERGSRKYLKGARITKCIRVLVFLSLSFFPIVLAPIVASHAASTILLNDPLGTFQGTGQTPLYWPGDEKINNTSFENGNIQPWTVSSYNANASSNTVISPGFNDNHAVQLSITSGNLTSSSYERLTQDLSLAQAVFSNNTLLQASAQVTTLSGTSGADGVGAIVTLASSTGTTVRLHYIFASGAALPANTTSDAYLKVAGLGSTTWISITQYLARDTRSAFPSLASSIDAVKSVSLYVDSMSLGNPNRDPRIKFYDHFGIGTWNSSDTVVYDSDQDGTYQLGDRLLFNSTYSPAIGSSIINDPLIKFVDLNQTGSWGILKPVVYDCNNNIPGDCGNNVVDTGEPILYGNPIVGSLLMDPIRQKTTSSFDQIELFAPTNKSNLAINGGFETGTLASWGNQAGFSISTTAHSGSYSALGSITGGNAQLAQSVDSQPVINSQSLFKAYANIAGLTGTTINDTIDVWLGLSDNKATPVSIYYIFDTGTGILPSNATGSIYYKAPSFGTLNQWLGINRTLLQDTALFNSQGFSGPYSVNLIALEVKSQGSGMSSAYFDDISLSTGSQLPSSAPLMFHAASGENTTYTYTVSNLQSGAFSVQVPTGQSVLNITTPALTKLQASDYSVTKIPPVSLINIPNSTGSRYLIGGTYHIYATSKNTVGTLYASDPSTQAVLNLTRSLNPGQRANLVELSLDPFSMGIPGANSTISLWSSSGTMLNSWTGVADGAGFYRVNDIALPASSGTYTIQGTSYSNEYVGVRTVQVSLSTGSTPGPLNILLIIAIIVAVIAGLTGFVVFYRRRSRKINDNKASVAPNQVRNRPPPSKKK